MSLEVYHLHLSQSERIVWLLEEMEIPYDLKIFKRDPVTCLAPADLKATNPTGTAPYFRDTTVSPPVCLSESTAIMTYILEVYGPKAKGSSRMQRQPGDKDYAQFLQWYHWGNGSFMASMMQQMALNFSGLDATTGAAALWKARLHAQLKLVDEHLGRNKWFAGDEVTAADCMNMFAFSTGRGFTPLDLGAYKNVLRWMRDVSQREAYKKAVETADEGMEPMIGADVRRFTEFAALKPILEKM